MLIDGLLLLIYLSFLVDFVIWPVPSEVSTVALMKKRSIRPDWSNTWMIISQLMILSLWCTPLLYLTFWTRVDSSDSSQLLTWVGVSLALIGRAITLVASKTIRQNGLTEVLSVSIYRFSRHPIVLGLHITLAGLLITVQWWVLVFPYIVSLRYFHQKIVAEEEILIREHGDAYIRYAGSIPRYLFLLPR